MENLQPLHKCSIDKIRIKDVESLPFYENIRIDLSEEYSFDEVDQMLKNADCIYLPSLLIIQYDNKVIDYYEILDDNTVRHTACCTELEI